MPCTSMVHGRRIRSWLKDKRSPYLTFPNKSGYVYTFCNQTTFMHVRSLRLAWLTLWLTDSLALAPLALRICLRSPFLAHKALAQLLAVLIRYMTSYRSVVIIVIIQLYRESWNPCIIVGLWLHTALLTGIRLRAHVLTGLWIFQNC